MLVNVGNLNLIVHLSDSSLVEVNVGNLNLIVHLSDSVPGGGKCW